KQFAGAMTHATLGRVSRSTRMTLTSYTVLAILLEGERTSYEISRMLQGPLGDYLDRSTRALYYEPSRLASLGYVQLTTGARGRQERTICSITPAGRTALTDWGASEPTSPEFQSEALVRLFLSDSAPVSDIQRAVAILRRQVVERARNSFEKWPLPVEC